MERKLRPSEDFTEIAIKFGTIQQALQWISRLIEVANQELDPSDPNEDWPTSIYWEGQEVHFYIDEFAWGRTTEHYLNESQDETDYQILESQAW